jgi:hypothetical protein
VLRPGNKRRTELVAGTRSRWYSNVGRVLYPVLGDALAPLLGDWFGAIVGGDVGKPVGGDDIGGVIEVLVGAPMSGPDQEMRSSQHWGEERAIRVVAKCALGPLLGAPVADDVGGPVGGRQRCQQSSKLE